MRKNSFKANQSDREDDTDTKELGSTDISRAASATEDLGETPTSATARNQVSA